MGKLDYVRTLYYILKEPGNQKKFKCWVFAKCCPEFCSGSPVIPACWTKGSSDQQPPPDCYQQGKRWPGWLGKRLSKAIKAKARSASPWGRELPAQWLAGEVSDRQEIHRLKAGEEQEKERHQLSGPNTAQRGE